MGSISPAQWWNSDTVTVLTGGNKGVGFSIVQKLALEGITVLLTARDEGRGVQATNDLHLKNVVFHKLDIRSAESVTKFVDWIKRKYGGRDILVNNASVNYFDNVYEHAVECIDINYRGTVNLTEKLLPMLKPSSAGARIVNIFTNENLRQQFVDASKFDQKFLNGYAMKFVDASQSGEIEENKTTFAFPAYCFSKLLANAYYTRLLAQRVAERPEGKKIYVNCLHPGNVDAGMYTQWRESVDDATFAQMEASGTLNVISAEQSRRHSSVACLVACRWPIWPLLGQSERDWLR